MKSTLWFILILSLLFSDCASIVSKSSYPVSIQSQPVGANFTITNHKGTIIHQGITPETVTLSAGSGFFSGSDYTVRVNLPGYDERVMTVTSKLDGWYFGNILLFPFAGLGALGVLIIDPVTGAMWKLQDHVTANLYTNDSFLNQYDKDVRIMVLNDVPTELRNLLVQVK